MNSIRSSDRGGEALEIDLVPPALVLVANAQEWTARSLESVLAAKGFAILYAFTGAQTVEQASVSRPDAILIDVNLPDMGAPELCRALRVDPACGPTTPLLVISSGATRQEAVSEALEAGAWDFCSLPLNIDPLVHKLVTFIRSKRAADRAREQSLVDLESGFYNVQGMLVRVKELALQAARHDLPIGCVVFAAEPQTPEAEPGRAREAVELFKRLTRGSDAIGRLGPREFVVLAPQTDREGALGLARRIADAASRGVPDGNGGLPPTEIHAGCFAVPNFHGADLDPVDLLIRATVALRRSQALPDQPILFWGEPGAAN
ncbi:MAG: response regulator [Longimicrobiales bacterium]